jgi:ureidoglycolate hydrolase
MAWTGAAILPTGTQFNPFRPERNEYFDSNEFDYIVANANRPDRRPSRVFSSAGDLGVNWDLGTIHETYHDQTGKQGDRYVVVGTVNFKTGEMRGHVPNRSLPYSVFK